MEILAGVALCLFVQALFFLGRRTWRKTLASAAPQPPRTPAQQANAEAFDDERKHHPQVVSIRLQRRTRRGPRRKDMEDDYDPFE